MQTRVPVQWQRTDFYFIVGVIGTILLYFHEILTLQTGFYSGDHRQQHYPWAFFYAEQLKQGLLPWWTSLFGCGFPLLAEGQVGALYPLNFLFYKFFPFDFAYTYNILFHYVLGAGFFYLLVRSRGISGFAAFLGCLIYLFGTAQGGYYYNIISLKTLIWFPLALYFIFRIFEEQKYKFLFWLALIFTFQLCAGYLQYAVYAIAFCGLTCLWLAILRIREGKFKDAMTGLATAFAAAVLGVLCAMPQLGATWELSLFSNRFDFPVEFAFVGSVTPLAMATFFFPHWDGFLRAEIYFGAIGLLFFMHAFRRPGLKGVSYFVFGFFMAIGLALGGFNPLYRWAVEWSGFSSFRIPAKFIFFAGFYGAILCAYGAQAWFSKQEEVSHRKTWWLWSLTALIAGVGVVFSHYFMQIFRKPLSSYFSDYIHKNYADSVIRPHSMEVYQQKLIDVYEGVVSATYPLERENLIFLFFILCSWGFVVVCRNRKLPQQMVMFGLAAVLFANLWAFGNTSVRGGLKTKEFLEPPSKIISYLKEQNSSSRVHRVYRDIYGADKLPIMTHNNILFGQRLVGAYSPLITKAFYEGMSDLGDVNDSNALKVSSREQFLAASDKIDFLNIEWILSDHAFSFDRYQKVAEENDIFLYRNPHVKSRAQLIRQPGVRVDITDKQNSIFLEFECEYADQLILSDVFYPGWKAMLNGQPVSIERHADLFRSVNIPEKGKWRLEMRYEPMWQKWLPPSMILAVFLLLAPFLFRRRNE